MNSDLHQKNITLENDNIIYPMKQKDLCDYDTKCIMSTSLMFYDIIMGTQIDNNIIYMYKGSFLDTRKFLSPSKNIEVTPCTYK